MLRVVKRRVHSNCCWIDFRAVMICVVIDGVIVVVEVV